VRNSLILGFVLALASSGAVSHSLEPGRLNVWSYENKTSFRLTAVNRFSHHAAFEVEMFTDKTYTTNLDGSTNVTKFRLKPNGTRVLTIFVKDVPKNRFYVCTKGIPLKSGSTEMALATRVCTGVRAYARSY
jgi:hypothetical protein